VCMFVLVCPSPILEMTYTVLGRTLNPTHIFSHSLSVSHIVHGHMTVISAVHSVEYFQLIFPLSAKCMCVYRLFLSVSVDM